MRHLLGFALLFAACSSSPAPQNALITARPYDSTIPTSYDPSKPTPLVVLLHGYGATPFLEDSYFGMSEYAETAGFLYADPSGTIDSTGSPFWNATDACCDMDHTGVDDVAYLNAVVDDMEAHYNVDRKRVFFVGHSNGGFMSHRMACDAASRIAAIVSLAGAQWFDLSHCKPSEAVSVLEVHGDADTEVPYDGGPDLPSAPTTVSDWAQLDGCGTTSAMGTAIDLVDTLPGAETQPLSYPCTKGAAELWTVHGGIHVPPFRLPDWPAAVYGFLSAHPKP